MPSFTAQIPNLVAIGPVTEVRLAVPDIVAAALKKANAQVPAPIRALAMVDTGATGSVIQQGVAKQLGLNPVGQVSINTPSFTNVQCYEYVLRILFPNNVDVETFVIEAPLQGQNIQCLIGRALLRHGVLIYIGYTNTFTLSF